MIIILPKSKYSSPLDYLNQEKISLNELNSTLAYTKNVHLYMPKFNYEFEIEYELKEALQDMGIKLAFSNKANYDIFNQNVETYLSKIKQKTYIKIDEKGTEAATVTTSPGPNYRPEKEYYMYVDHNFIYMIQSYKMKDTDNKYLIPFIGIVNKLDGQNLPEDYEEEEKQEEKQEQKEEQKTRTKTKTRTRRIYHNKYQNYLKINLGIIIIYLITLFYIEFHFINFFYFI